MGTGINNATSPRRQPRRTLLPLHRNPRLQRAQIATDRHRVKVVELHWAVMPTRWQVLVKELAALEMGKAQDAALVRA